MTAKYRSSALPSRVELGAQRHFTRSVCALAVAAGLSGCTTSGEELFGNKVDYRQGAGKIAPISVPPDLTQLADDPRYQRVANAQISANELAKTPAAGAKAAAAPGSNVAVNSLKGMRIERLGQTRWLVSPESPDVLWPRLVAFWEQAGFTLDKSDARLGIMETDWREDRTKRPSVGLAGMINKIAGNLADSGLRDRYRTRVERTAQGTEIYISHRGMQEVAESNFAVNGGAVRWDGREVDPNLEAEMLAQVMVALAGESGTKDAKPAADALVAQAGAKSSPAPATADSLSLNDNFDRAWRRVGVAIDRAGFTVEDRDRKQGQYFVRYVDPKLAGQDEPNFVAKLFGAKRADLAGQRYQVQIKPEGDRSLVTVHDEQGQRLSDANAKQILALIDGELR